MPNPQQKLGRTEFADVNMRNYFTNLKMWLTVFALLDMYTFNTLMGSCPKICKTRSQRNQHAFLYSPVSEFEEEGFTNLH